MNKTDGLAFWKKYTMTKTFVCSNCGTITIKALHTCPKCKRGMVNAETEKKS